MRTINALGFIEVYGLVAGIEAADAMLKSAQVRVLREHNVHPGQVTLVVEGDLAACRAAVSAGGAAASRVGTVIACHIIGRPDDDTETMILNMLREHAVPANAQTLPPAAPPAPRAGQAAKSTPTPAPKAEEKPKPAPGAAKAKAPSPAGGKLGELLAYIAKSKQGYTWKELKSHFPGLPQQVRKHLDAAAAAGELRKNGARYGKPEARD